MGDLVEGKLNLLTSLKVTLKLNLLRILSSLKYQGEQKGRTTELWGLILTSLERVELQGDLVNILTAWLIIEGLKSLLMATDFK